MFQDIDETLKKILDDPAMVAPPMTPPLTELRGADKSFVTPDRNFPPTLSQATVNLFLYDVKENRDLRDPTPILEKVGTSFIRRPPPLRMDCSYIVTTWSSATGAAKVAEEHHLLAQALLWLSRFPTIPPAKLQGTSLENQLYPPPMTVAQVDPNKNAGEFWDALAIPPRPAFYLTVTIAMELGTQVSGPLVSTRSSNTHAGTTGIEETWVQIGGRVLMAGGQTIPDALVDILDAGLRTKSESDGRYSFPRVPVGTRTVRVVAVGFQPKTQPLVVPGLPEEYDVTLVAL